MDDPPLSAFTRARRPPAGPGVATRLLVVLAAVVVGAAAGALFVLDRQATATKPKRPPVTEEWVPNADAGKKPDDDPPPKTGPPRMEFDGLMPPAAEKAPPPGTPPKDGDREAEKKVVVRLSNPRRQPGRGDTDDLEIDYEVLKSIVVIVNDKAMVKTRTGTAEFAVTSVKSEGTLRLPGAVPARYAGPIDVWLVLRRNGEDLLSNTVTLK
jgi:hypothetical protein